MNRYCQFIIIIAILVFFGCSQEKPDASFSMSTVNPRVDESVSFTNTSLNAYSYEWYFGDGSESNEENPTHVYKNEGTYYITLIARNSAGITQAFGFVNVSSKFTATFNNTVFTDIYITLNNETKTCPVEGSVTFEFDENPGSYIYYAETYGKTSSGSVLGEVIEWEFTHYVDGMTSDNTDLDISEDYFFLYIQNSGYTALSPVRVNVGYSDEIEENVEIPADGVQYKLGYYRAYNYTRIEADLVGTEYYIYWENGSEFDFPWTHNQYLLAQNTQFKSVENIVIPSGNYDKRQVNLGELLKTDGIKSMKVNLNHTVDYGTVKRIIK